MIERMTRLSCDNCGAKTLTITGITNARPALLRAQPDWHLWNGADICPDCWDEHDDWSPQKKVQVWSRAGAANRKSSRHQP